MTSLVISRSQEFEYCIGYPIAIVGEVLTYPSQLALNELAEVIKPLTNESSGKWTKKAIEIGKKILMSFALLLSLPYHLTVGLTGYGLGILTSFARKKITLISENTNQHKVEEPKVLKVCTFNTALLPDFINTFKPVGTRIRPIDGSLEERVQGIATAILKRNDDIVCLQEVFDPRAGRLLINHLSKNYPHIASHVGPKALLFNSGLMILSKKPISKARFRPFSISKGADSWAGKGVMGVSIELGQNRRLTVLNTHLNSHVGIFGWLDDVEEIQSAQMEDVDKLAKKFTKKSNGSETQRIVCGDFNKGHVAVAGYQVVSDTIDHILICETGSQFTKIQGGQIDSMGRSSDHPAVAVTLSA